jgi:hypothetical protein
MIRKAAVLMRSIFYFLILILINPLWAQTIQPSNEPIQAQPMEQEGKTQNILIQSADIKITSQQAIEIFKTQALMIYLKNKAFPSLEGFSQADFVRKQLTLMAETEVLFAQAQKANISVSEAEVFEMFPFTKENLQKDPVFQKEDHLNRLFAYFKQQATVRKWMNAEIEKMPIEMIEQEYMRRHTSVRVLLAQVSRVPSYQEINQAQEKYQQEIQNYYQENQHRFSQSNQFKANVLQITQTDLDRIIPPNLITLEPTPEEKAKSLLQRMQVFNQKFKEALKANKSFEQVCQSFEIKCTFAQMIKEGNLSAQLPKNADALKVPGALQKEPYLIDIHEHQKGWRMYELIDYHVGFTRELSDVRIQTEIASEILQIKDELPAAKQLATQVKDFLEKLPLDLAQSWDQIDQKITEKPAALADWLSEKITWLKQRQVRVQMTEPFQESKSFYTPKIGKSDDLHPLLFKMKPGQVSGVFSIRQVLVVAKLLEKIPPSKPWASEKSAFIKQWQSEQRQTWLEDYLRIFLKDKPKKINLELMKNLDISPLRQMILGK